MDVVNNGLMEGNVIVLKIWKHKDNKKMNLWNYFNFLNNKDNVNKIEDIINNNNKDFINKKIILVL